MITFFRFPYSENANHIRKRNLIGKNFIFISISIYPGGIDLRNMINRFNKKPKNIL